MILNKDSHTTHVECSSLLALHHNRPAYNETYSDLAESLTGTAQVGVCFCPFSILFRYLRIIGLLTIAQGMFYLPFVLQYFLGFESASTGGIWFLVQSFMGVALCSKELFANKKWVKSLLIGNLIYQMIWIILLLDHLTIVRERVFHFLPYSLHLILVVLIDLYFLRFHKKPRTSMLN